MEMRANLVVIDRIIGRFVKIGNKEKGEEMV